MTSQNVSLNIINKLDQFQSWKYFKKAWACAELDNAPEWTRLRFWWSYWEKNFKYRPVYHKSGHLYQLHHSSLCSSGYLKIYMYISSTSIPSSIRVHIWKYQLLKQTPCFWHLLYTAKNSQPMTFMSVSSCIMSVLDISGTDLESGMIQTWLLYQNSSDRHDFPCCPKCVIQHACILIRPDTDLIILSCVAFSVA